MASTSGGDGVVENWRGGWSIAAGRYSATSGNPNAEAFAAIGAPGLDTGAQAGMVMVRTLQPNSGLFGYGAIDEDVYPPSTTLGRQFGRALLASDVRECHPGSLFDAACGHEILVGNPDVSGAMTSGEVHLYEYDYAGLQWLGALIPPGGTPVGAQFGYAMTAPRTPEDSMNPWAEAPDPPPWIAVGAPEIDAVFIYAVNPTSAWPLTLVQTLTYSSIGRKSGRALAAGDFNNDGLMDLAVGAPKPFGTALGGRVFVHQGVAGGPAPLAAMPVSMGRLGTGPAQLDDFGAALTVSRVTQGASASMRDTLIAGAPLTDVDGDVDSGGVCTFQFQECASSTVGCAPIVASTQCTGNPWASTTFTDNERFGTSLAAANFIAIDAQNRDVNEVADNEEVAVGRPGWNGGVGRVEVFFTYDGFPEILDGYDLPIAEYGSVDPTSAFGTSLASVVVQPNSWADLVVGAPGSMVGAKQFGSYSATRTVAPAACAVGDWLLTDSWSSVVELRVAEASGVTSVSFLDPYHSQLVDPTGDPSVCEAQIEVGGILLIPFPTAAFTLPEGFQLDLPGAVACTGATVFPAIDAAPLIKAIIMSAASGVDPGLIDLFVEDFVNTNGPQSAVVTLTADTSVIPATLELDIDLSGVSWGAIEDLTLGTLDATCRPENLPWLAVQDSVGLCDG